MPPGYARHDHTFPVHTTPVSGLVAAIRSGDWDGVKRLLEQSDGAEVMNDIMLPYRRGVPRGC